MDWKLGSLGLLKEMPSITRDIPESSTRAHSRRMLMKNHLNKSLFGSLVMIIFQIIFFIKIYVNNIFFIF